MIPPFDERGNLPSGIHKADWNLAVLDRVLLDFSEDRKAQKARFGGELFPADMATEPAGTHILDFFQRDRVSVQPKGIVEIDLETGL
jgi:hypothetical protein